MTQLSRVLAKKLKKAFNSGFRGDFYLDDNIRELYSRPIMSNGIIPICVAMPKDGDDIQFAVEIAHDLKIPITMRGSGSTNTGAAYGSGIILDLAKHMNRILSIDSDHKQMTVEAGVVYRDIYRFLKKYNLFLPPKNFRWKFSTIGGMLGVNAAGYRSLRYGSMKDSIIGINAILADGSECLFSQSEDSESKCIAYLSKEIRNILGQSKSIQSTNQNSIRKNSSGYLINSEDGFGHQNLLNIMPASEGTLAICTEIDLKLVKKHKYQEINLFFFDSLEALFDAVPIIESHEPVMMEMFEKSIIESLGKCAMDINILLYEEVRYLLIVEFEGPDISVINHVTHKLQKQLLGVGKPAIAHKFQFTMEEQQKIYAMIDRINLLISNLHFPLRTTSILDDVVVPKSKSYSFIHYAYQVAHKYDLPMVVHGHIGEGHFQLHPFFNTKYPHHISQMDSMINDIILHIRSMNGSISGENGDGRIRSELIKVISPEKTAIFKQIKTCFDPDNILNPGVIVTDEKHSHHTLFQNQWVDPDEIVNKKGVEKRIADEISKCTFCGACRAYCPVFLAFRDEWITPRAKIQLLYNLIQRSVSWKTLKMTPTEHRFFDMCIGCEICETSCPVGIDISSLIRAVKQKFIQGWGESISNRILNTSKPIDVAGNSFPRLTNYLVNRSIFRKSMEMFIDLDSQISLPPIVSEPLKLSKTMPIRWSAERRIAYLPDVYSTYFDLGKEGVSVLAVIGFHDFDSFIPQLDYCSLHDIQNGQPEQIKMKIMNNFNTLRDLLKQQYQIVFSSPEYGLAMKKYYCDFINHDDAPNVYYQIQDFNEFITELLSQGKLSLDLHALPYTIAIHQPCVHRALQTSHLTAKILRLIPGVDVYELEPKCCGMGGTFGLKSSNRFISEKTGQALFNEIKNLNPDIIVSSCGLCRLQITEMTKIRAVHPARILAESYGLFETQET